MLKKTKIKILVVVAVIAILGLGVTLFYKDVTEEEKPTHEELPVPSMKMSSPSQDVLDKRGPRPKKTRVRNGELQVEDVEKAVLLAEGAFQRVERELASASSDEERARLEKKRAMIKRAIDAMNNQ